jgi:hypothetical protein
VRQNDDTQKLPEVKNQKEFIFLIKYSSLLANGISISQRHTKEHMSFSGQDSWETITDGLRVTLRFSIFHTLAALMFEKDSTIRFAVLFEVDGLEQAGVDILTPVADLPLEEIVTSFSHGKSGSSQQLCRNRITKPVSSGFYVSVSLRKRRIHGQKLYVIDITAKT